MKDSKKFVRIMAILLAALLIITFIVPAFAMFAYAAEPKADGDAFIISFETDSGSMMEQGKPENVSFTVSDQRISFEDETTEPNSSIGINITSVPGAFSHGNVGVNIISKDTNGIVYKVSFEDFVYNGGATHYWNTNVVINKGEVYEFSYPDNGKECVVIVNGVDNEGIPIGRMF